jgi:hypothetical protein
MSESKYYNYGVKHVLIKEIEHIQTTDNYISINLCVYSINTDTRTPFLQYLLVNNGYSLLTLPKLPMYTLFNREDIIPYSKVYLSGILNANFEEFSNGILFDGFYEYNDDLYLFFDITKCKIHVYETHLSNHVRFGLMDEIVNHRSICETQIDNTTSSFFIRNESIIYLYDEHNNAFETPVVGFVGKQTETKMKFTETFGENAKDKTAILGPYFYFTNYKNSIKQAYGSYNEKTGKYNKGGIIRFALFMGHTKYVENAPNDPIDESEIKQHRLQDTTLNKQKEVLTLRISDHDGLWATAYDSVYVGNLELDDGSLLDDTPMIVLKEYVNQLPLSGHYIRLREKDDEQIRIIV